MNNYDLNFKENPNYIKKPNVAQKGREAKGNLSDDLHEQGQGNEDNHNDEMFQKEGLFRKKNASNAKREDAFGTKEEAENQQNTSENKGKNESEKKNKM